MTRRIENYTHVIPVRYHDRVYCRTPKTRTTEG